MPPHPYTHLAPIYDDAGFADYTSAMTPLLLTYAQQTGWMGKHILDLGCGTGSSTAFFSTNNFEVVGLDSCAEMLQVAQMRMEGTGFLGRLQQGDLRQFAYPDEQDLIFMLGNVLNELANPREVELVFGKVAHALAPGKRFIFDMLTLQGLGEHLGSYQHILDVSNRLFITVEAAFVFESMSLRQHFNIFSMVREELWERQTTSLTIRSWPQQIILNLLEKVGLDVLGQFTTTLKPFDPNNDREGRVIFMAQKPPLPGQED